MIHWLHGLVWGPALLFFMLGSGVLFTVRSGMFQIRRFGVWWKATAGSLASGDGAEEKKQDKVGRVQAACTALAATIGTGNIVGVATALCAGGPGAVFWMWVSALFGMMTAYAETFLSLRFRRKLPDGKWLAGPCAYLSGGLKRPGLALVYGLLCLSASLGMGSMVQSNAVSQTLSYSLDVPPVVCAVAVTALVLDVVSGGTDRIMQVTVRLIPAAAVIYTVFSAAVLIAYRNRILPAVGQIFGYALLPGSVLGGVGGYGVSRAFRYGIARGVFSNEAGLGTLAGLHGATEDSRPQEQGMFAMFEVFFDTIFICTLTALVILCASGGAEGLAKSPYDGAALAGRSFGSVLGGAGEAMVSLAMAVFAFSTMIAWYFLGRQTLRAAAGLAAARFPGRVTEGAGFWRILDRTYLILYGFSVFLGCVGSLKTVWELSDVLNGLMAVPNLLALFLLRKDVKFPE